MKQACLALAFTISSFVFCQGVDSLKLANIYKAIDSIEYSEMDFLKFKKAFSKNKYILDSISRKASTYNNIELDLLEFSDLSFKDAKVKYGETNVKKMIFFHYKSCGVIEKFKQLDAAFQAKKDSLNNKKQVLQKNIKFSNSIKKEIELYKKYLDSLKKN